MDANRLRWFDGEIETAQKQFENELKEASGPRLAVVKGAMLDLLEYTGQLNEASRLLSGSGKPMTDEAYWSLRKESISKLPYGPFDQPLNEMIFKIREANSRLATRDNQADWDADWLDLISELPPRMPFLVSAHPTFEPFRDSVALRRANCRSRRL